MAKAYQQIKTVNATQSAGTHGQRGRCDMYFGELLYGGTPAVGVFSYGAVDFIVETPGSTAYVFATLLVNYNLAFLPIAYEPFFEGYYFEAWIGQAPNDYGTSGDPDQENFGAVHSVSFEHQGVTVDNGLMHLWSIRRNLVPGSYTAFISGNLQERQGFSSRPDGFFPPFGSLQVTSAGSFGAVVTDHSFDTLDIAAGTLL